MKAVLAAAPLLLLAAAAAGNGMPVFSEEDIKSASSCMVNDSQLAICAGDKLIATGISFSQALYGVDLRSGWGNPKINRFSADTPPEAGWAADVVVTFTQRAESGGPEWSRTYYVLTGEQLAHMLAKARSDPDWKP